MKTTSSNLTDGVKTMPVSVVNLQTTPPAGKPGIISFTRGLSASDQIIITNGMTDYTYQTVDYTLRYYTNGNNSTVNAAAAGTYATQIVYIVLPL